MSGPYNLGDRAVTSALTDEVITVGADANGNAQAYIDGLDWMAAVSLFVNFTYGSGGTSCSVKVQTSLDGVNWIDIARFDFTTASAAKRCNISGLSTLAVGAVAALSTEGELQGFLGDRLRAVVTSVGAYAGNTAVSVRAGAR